MRRAQNPEFLMENGKVVGINMGADFTAEHEIGIRNLRDLFGCRADDMGVERLAAAVIPEDHMVYRTGTMTVDGEKMSVSLLLCVNYNWHMDRYNSQPIREVAGWCELMPYNAKCSLVCSWDDSEFGILALGDNVKKLEELCQAFKDKDVAIGMSGKQHLFQNPGLLIRRLSSVSQEERDDLMARDKRAKQLVKDAEATKVEKKLRKAGKDWYALSPRYASEEEQKKTKYKVVFWLNPCDQRNNNYGWFTVEELLLWAKGEGPIPVKKGL